MTESNQPGSEHLTDAWARRERIVEEFEAACQRGERPDIGNYLRDGGPEDAELLVQLVHADLEYRLLAGEAVRVETYLECYPELCKHDRKVVALIVTDYDLRRKREPDLTPQNYLKRFPHYAAELLAALGPASVPETSTDPDGNQPHLTPRPEGAAAVLPPGAAVTPQAGHAQPSIPGYEIVGELGRGGMGVVYKAVQTGLKRLVALKMILAAEHAGPTERARFRREAEAVAQLQHPNIVQIHEVDEHHGLPFFSMEFVEGGNLAQQLAGTPLPPRRAAVMVETLARAMHAAHTKGIVHRDLKPANVLMTANGVPKVTDFGLVKRLDMDTVQTPPGAILGTPSYMAPEQVTEALHPIGPLTDVYAVGAILYETLTGRPPFRAASMMETLDQVRNGEPVSPSRLQPNLPRDLETICLKCLAKEPARRYADAAALADDLRRFLDSQPVRARPVGWLGRGLKWAKRRPAVAVLVGVSIAGPLVLMAVVLVYTLRLRAALEDVKASFLMARQAVDDYSLKVSRDKRLLENNRPLRKELLETAVPFYEKLVAQAKDAGMQAELGRAFQQLGFVTAEVGDTAKAIAAYEAALHIFTSLSTANPEVPDLPDRLCEIHNGLGRAYLFQDAGQAEMHLQEAIRLGERLVAEHPDPDQARRYLGQSYSGLASLYRRMGKTEEAEDLLQKDARIVKHWVGQFPDDSTYQRMLSSIQNNLGNLYQSVGKTAAAEEALREAVVLAELLVKRSPESSELCSELAGRYYSIGVLYRAVQKPAKAEEAYQQALDHEKVLVEKYPEVTQYQVALAITYHALGNIHLDNQKLAEAAAAYEAALNLRRKLVNRYPEEAGPRDNLARSLLGFGFLHQVTGEVAKAEEAYREALAITQALAKNQPAIIEYKTLLAGSYLSLGRLLGEGGDLRAALDLYAKGVPYLEEVLQKEPRNRTARGCFCNTHWRRAEALSKLGQHQEAAEAWNLALKLDAGESKALIRSSRAAGLARAGNHAQATAEASDLARDKSLDDDALYDLAIAYALATAAVSHDVTLPQAERDQRATEYADQAMAFLEKARAAGYCQFPGKVAKLKTDKELEPLRPRPDFQEWLAKETKTGGR